MMTGAAENGITPLVILLWILNMLLDAGGQLAFKAAAAADARAGTGWARWRWMARRPWLWVGLGCYVAEFLAWLAFLSLVPLSDGVLMGSINIVVVMIGGRLLFQEKLTPLRVFGILLVSAGVAVVGMNG